MTITLGWLALIFLISSIPEPPSIEMSTMAMSGFATPINCNAFGALSASPQTSKVGLLIDQVGEPFAHQGMVIHQ